jgi:hypothetical protein
VDGFASFASAEAGLVQWLDDEAWTTGDGPRALFYAAVAWLREGKMLRPGVTTLVELVATVRQAAEDRLYDTLATSVTAAQARSLEAILEVPEGRRRSQLDLWRRGERSTTGGAWCWPWTGSPRSPGCACVRPTSRRCRRGG